MPYGLTIENDHSRRNVTRWLVLALISLIAAGIFSILLVLARTPYVQSWIPFIDFFHTALVVHVNLSVLIWLLSIAAVMWTLSVTTVRPRLDFTSFVLAAIGTGVIVIAPFVGAGNPLMSNYVPVLQHPIFFIGLTFFMLGIALHVIRTLYDFPRIGAQLTATSVLRTGTALSAVITGIAIASTLASWLDLPREMDGQIYFEFLFWGGGHVIQFAYTLLMMICWAVLAEASGCRIELTPRLMLVFLFFMTL
ncbi:MAG: cbb3-type cytochrome c oxidase subunit I, partial [Woeseiaceae bacterium]